MNNGEKIELNIQAFDLEYFSDYQSDGSLFCGYDYVEVIDIDGNYNEKFCGNNTIPDSITSTGTSMIVNMRTDYSVTRHGFAATWTAVSAFRDGPVVPRTTEEVDRVIGVYEASAWNYLQLSIEICYLGKVLEIIVIIEQNYNGFLLVFCSYFHCGYQNLSLMFNDFKIEFLKLFPSDI